MSTSFIITSTPMAKLGAKTTGIARAASRIVATCPGSNPVVPITMGLPAATHAARCARVPAGRVKSTRTSACASAAAGSEPIATPFAPAASSPASRPANGGAGDLQRRGDGGAGVAAAGLEEGAAHAPARARDREPHRAHFFGAVPAAERVGPPSMRTTFSFSKNTEKRFCSTSFPRCSLRK